LSSFIHRARVFLIDHTMIKGTWIDHYGDLYVIFGADDGRLLYIPITSILYIEVLENE